MASQYFEDLEIWQEARRLTNSIYKITKNEHFSNDPGVRDQIRQASLSIMSGIAEGCERGSNQELSRFLSAAKGSCGTVRSQLYIALDRGYIDAKDCKHLTNRFKKLSAMIQNLTIHPKATSHKDTDERPKRGSIKKELETILGEVDKEKA
jgi:four helix bundle protein